MSLKEVSYIHQVCIYLIKNRVNINNVKKKKKYILNKIIKQVVYLN